MLLRSPRRSDSFAQDDFWGPLFVVLAYAVISLWGQFRVRRSAYAKHARPSPMHIGSSLSLVACAATDVACAGSALVDHGVGVRIVGLLLLGPGARRRLPYEPQPCCCRVSPFPASKLPVIRPQSHPNLPSCRPRLRPMPMAVLRCGLAAHDSHRPRSARCPVQVMCRVLQAVYCMLHCECAALTFGSHFPRVAYAQ